MEDMRSGTGSIADVLAADGRFDTFVGHLATSRAPLVGEEGRPFLEILTTSRAATGRCPPRRTRHSTPWASPPWRPSSMARGSPASCIDAVVLVDQVRSAIGLPGS